MFISEAWAQSAAATSPSIVEQSFPFILILIVFYFLIIRPAQSRQKAQATFVSGLKKGDEVLTSGGIMGRIEGLTDAFVTLEIADGVRIRILKTQISQNAQSELVKK